MRIFNDILLGGAEIVLSAWEGIKAFFVAVFGAIDVVLAPILSPLFGVLNPI